MPLSLDIFFTIHENLLVPLRARNEIFHLFCNFLVFDKFKKYITLSNISPIHITQVSLCKVNYSNFSVRKTLQKTACLLLLSDMMLLPMLIHVMSIQTLQQHYRFLIPSTDRNHHLNKRCSPKGPLSGLFPSTIEPAYSEQLMVELNQQLCTSLVNSSLSSNVLGVHQQFIVHIVYCITTCLLNLGHNKSEI